MRKNVFSSSIKILIVSLLLLAVFFQKERSQKLMALALILWIAVTAGIFLFRKSGKLAKKCSALKDGGNTGTALFFVLIPEAMKDDEFRENYDLLGRCKNDGYADMDEAEKAAFILCDNLYRRIEGADTLPTAGIKLNKEPPGEEPAVPAHVAQPLPFPEDARKKTGSHPEEHLTV